MGCINLASVNIPNSVDKLEDSIFSGCESLVSITIPESITEIGPSAFCRCINLSSITIPRSVTEIGLSAFDFCFSLSTITLPESVTKIGVNAFANCTSLSSITIPDSETVIGKFAFVGCKSLTSVFLPGSVRIEEGIFFDCNHLTSVFYSAKVPIFWDYSIIYHNNNAVLYVPEEAVERCKKILPWSNFRNIQAYNFSTGSEEIEIESPLEPSCEIFNLNGVKVGDDTQSLSSGLYIIRDNKKTKKVRVK